jgi:hypothetical protein
LLESRFFIADSILNLKIIWQEKHHNFNSIYTVIEG